MKKEVGNRARNERTSETGRGSNPNLTNARYDLAFQGELLDYYLGHLTEGLSTESR
jgi:hypothetical protein